MRTLTAAGLLSTVVTILVVPLALLRSGMPLPAVRHPLNGPADWQVPLYVEIVPGESSPGPKTYHADEDQNSLNRPARWCAAARPKEPLLNEARQMATGARRNYFAQIRDMNYLARVPASSVRVVSDEAICERAAKAYDRDVYSGGFTVEEHTVLHAVLVVQVGDAYLVDDLSDRAGFWNVVPYDRDWTQLLGHYGGGA